MDEPNETEESFDIGAFHGPNGPPPPFDASLDTPWGHEPLKKSQGDHYDEDRSKKFEMSLGPLEGLARKHGVLIPEGSAAVTLVTTTSGKRFPRNEFTPEDRPSGEWAKILDFSGQTFRNRMLESRSGATWQIVEVSSQRYVVHLDYLPKWLKTQPLRDDALINNR